MRTTAKNTPVENPNSSEFAEGLTKVIDAAGSKVEGAITAIKADGASQFERTKSRKGATVAADIAVATAGVAFLVAGGPFGIAAGVAMMAASLLHATTVTVPAIRGDK